MKKNETDAESLGGPEPFPLNETAPVTHVDGHVRGPSDIFTALIYVGGLIAGVSFLLLSSAKTACRGATRSTRLEWGARQEQIDTAILNANTLESSEFSAAPRPRE